MTRYRYEPPWRVSRLDGRVYLLCAKGRVICEIEPGQLHGPVPREVKMAIAEAIVVGETARAEQGGAIVDLEF